MMKYEEAENFLKLLRRNVFEKGNRDLVDDYFTDDLLGHYGSVIFNREDVKRRIDYVNDRYIHRMDHLLELVVISGANVIVSRIKQNGYDTVLCKLYTLDLVVIYRMRELKIAEVWLMSDRPIDYFASLDDRNEEKGLRENWSNEEIEKRDFALILENLHKRDSKPYVELTGREKECLFYLFKGLSAKEIAKELDISHRTVEYYLASVREKYDCSSKLELREKILLMRVLE